MKKILVKEVSDGKICELIFDSISKAINYLQPKGYSDYEISTMISCL